MTSSPLRSAFLLALLAVLFFVSFPSSSAQPGCYPCTVSSCASYFNGSAPNVSLGALSPASAAAECSTLNTDIGGFIATALNASCAANVAALSCEIIATVNQTETACNTSTIGLGTQFGNTSYFRQRCGSAVSCLGYTYQDEVVAAGACSSFTAFLGAVVAQPAPSAIPCAPCNITACRGLSSLPGVTDVVFYTGSLPGLNGSACPAQQAVAANLLASGLAGAPAAAVNSVVCDPLAALTTVDTQAACNAGLVDSYFDGVIFSSATRYNATWAELCQPTLSQVLNATAVSRLVASGYCVSPSAGLTNYAVQYLQAPPVTAASSSGAAPASASSSSSSSSSTGANAAAPVADGGVLASTLALAALSCLALAMA